MHGDPDLFSEVVHLLMWGVVQKALSWLNSFRVCWIKPKSYVPPASKEPLMAGASTLLWVGVPALHDNQFYLPRVFKFNFPELLVDLFL